MTGEPDPAAAWDAEYQAGRYRDDPPVPFIRDILTAAGRAGLNSGLYIGCGNGRNYLPLVAGGLDLTGLDISATAISQLADRAPGRRDRLVRGDLAALPADARYPVVIGIQVFQPTRRDPPAPGQWSQWEAIWRKAQSTAWRRRRQVDPAASAATPTSGRYHSHEATGAVPYPT
jgi:hypothetical protein